MRVRPARTVPVIAALVAMAAFGVVEAQDGRVAARVPVTVALVDRPSYADSPAAVILRRAEVTPRDVVLLRSDAADADLLSVTILALLAARSANGDTARADVVLRPRTEERAPAGMRVGLPWTRRVVADLRRAAPREVPGVGTVRAVEIWLPPTRRPKT